MRRIVRARGPLRCRLHAAIPFAAVLAVAVGGFARAQGVPAERLYGLHCAACHGAERMGGTGPALLPENLERLRPAAAARVIASGRPATQMPGFGAQLSEAEVKALADWIYRPPSRPVAWELSDVAASRTVFESRRAGLTTPAHRADPKKLFVVVEAGDHHVTVLDGERFEPVTRVATRYALHGGPKFSPDGRYVYFGSRDGWVQKYDLRNLEFVAEARAGINLRNIAVSGDGRWVIAANYLPHTLVVLDAADLAPVKLIPVRGTDGKTSRVSAVYDAAPRESFIAALKDLKEIWEIPYGPKTGPVYSGLVHDYRQKEGIAEPGAFPVRRIAVDDYLDDFFFDRGYDHVLGSSRDAKSSQVVNLHVRRRIASVALPGMPHLASGITWDWNGRTVLATPNLGRAQVTVIDTKDWSLVKEIPTAGPGFFLRSHEATPYAWVDAFNSPQKDTIQIIDKRSLEVVKTLRPAPGKTTAHVEFTADGRFALVSVWEDEGELLVYDAASFEIVKRLPMKKPSGKYNVANKIGRSDGTSH